MASNKLPKTMEAVYIASFLRSIADLRPTHVPFPRLTPSTLLIRITHTSPTHVDLLYCRGLHQNNQRHAKPPFVLGMEFAGVVVRSPSWCAYGYPPGAKVYGSCFDGAFAEYIAIDTTKTRGLEGIRRVPQDWSLAEACAMGASGAISLGAYYRGGLNASTISERQERGDTGNYWVLVTGATGGLGVAAVQIAKRLGAKVIALSSSSPQKQKMLRHIGADAVVSYQEEDWEKEVQRIADGQGVHIVYDGVGMVTSALKCVRHNGVVAIVGFAGRDNESIESVKMNRILLKSASVVGYRFGEHGRRDPAAVANIWRDFECMIMDGGGDGVNGGAGIRAVVYDGQESGERYRGVTDIPRAMWDLADKKVYGRAVVEIVDGEEAMKHLALTPKPNL